MGRLIARLKAWFARVRRRWPFVDHVVRTIQHFGQVRGSILSGGITYFGFLSVFPILALAFFVVGYISEYFPGAQDALETAIDQILPGIVTAEDPPPAGQISFDQIAATRNVAGVIGALGVLYTGLGFVSNLRTSLEAAFGVPTQKSYGFLPGKLRDLATLVLVGLILMVSVGLSGAVTQYTGDLLHQIGVESTPVDITVKVLSVLLGIASSALLFFALYRLLPHTDVPDHALWRGAFLAAVGFEAIKQLASFILGAAAGGALASLALSVTLLVWIYYFAQLTIYGASWAMTSPEARTRGVEVVPHVVPAFGAVAAGPLGAAPARSAEAEEERSEAIAASRTLLVAGALAAAAWAWIRHDKARSKA
ncbi:MULTISPECIES: YihY/virulence factor BrkB family protein [Mumia]|uniref:YihY/virulence factor BrkB family protein n=1 Tax=Mumia TaxID=1546255 RepID=UPI001423AEAF|nr:MULTISPECIES: YihY/virulence factor BrkB family protein [unclassified Mumia]QMW65648.1 YihY/virulence factor BrkB family protein [Mumia sp. ZJ1417]